MALTMFIGLFSVRIILQVLGEDDFGIYNVVGGIVTMLAFLNNSLSSATQRFLSFAMGKNSKEELRSIFCNSMTLYILVCIILLLFAETIGLWFVNNKLVIPENRMIAANWIYQFSVISFLCIIIESSYNAVVIAHERMSVYAYISIAEAVLKLAMIYALLVLGGDKLILYGFFLMLISIAIFLFYMVYCLRRFEETKYHFTFDKKIIKEMGNFAGWGVWGALSNIFKGQGLNILLNIFFGPVVNASRGIAYQVEGAVNTLVQNFYTAMRPQLIKSYAAGEQSDMFRLLYMSTRLGYYLMFLVYLVLIPECSLILTFWLGQIPENTIEFTKLVLISQLFIILANPLMTAIHATGKVVKYQFWSGCIFILVLPVSYVALKINNNCFWPFVILIISSVAYWILTIERCIKQINLSLKDYSRLIIKILFVSCILICGASLICNWMDEGWSRFIVVSCYTFIMGLLAIAFIDCTKSERNLVLSFIKRNR